MTASPYFPRKVNFGWIGESWQIFGQAAGIWIVAVLLYGLVSNLIQGALTIVFHNPANIPPPNPFGLPESFGARYGTNSSLTPLGQLISALFLWVFGAFQTASLYYMAVKQIRRESLSFGDLVGGGPYFGNMLLFNLLYFVGMILGAVVFCLGIFIVMGLLLPGAALVADGESASNAVARSLDAMKQDWLTAALFSFVILLLMVVSVIPCGLGLFVTIPMLHIVSALAYRDMIGMPNTGADGYGYDGPQPAAPPPAGVWPPPPR
jgi:uncharacterized membrane protein